MGKQLLFLFLLVAAFAPCHAGIVAGAGGTNAVARVRVSNQALEWRQGHILRIRVAWTNAPSAGFGVAHFVHEPATSGEPALTMLLGPNGFLKLQPATHPIAPEHFAAMDTPSAGGAHAAEIRMFAKPGGGVVFQGAHTDSWPGHALEIPAFSEAEVLLSGSIALTRLEASVYPAPTLLIVR